MAEPLRWLDFDVSETEEGHGTFDAMASVRLDQVAALHAEVAAVLNWADEAFPGDRGPLDEGYSWDFDLQASEESVTPIQLSRGSPDGDILAQRGAPQAIRYNLNLSITGTAAFCAALRERFDETP